MSAERLAKLKADLADAKEGYRQADYIDNYAEMRREQTYWTGEIARIRNEIALEAALEGQP